MLKAICEVDREEKLERALLVIEGILLNMTGECRQIDDVYKIAHVATAHCKKSPQKLVETNRKL